MSCYHWSVLFVGNIELSELRQYLNGPALEIEVHDRDRKGEECKPKPALFGDDLEDEKISNVGTVASKYRYIIKSGMFRTRGLFYLKS